VGERGSGYSFGKIHITNGDSVTRVRTDPEGRRSNLYLKYPLDFDPAPGLEFTAFPGCSRLSTGANGCQTYWAPRLAEALRRLPFIPVAETALLADGISSSIERVAVVSPRRGPGAHPFHHRRQAPRLGSGRHRLRAICCSRRMSARAGRALRAGSIRTIGTCIATRSASSRSSRNMPARRRQRAADPPSADPDLRVLPGNVLIWRYGRTFSHGAIVSQWPMIIHASFPGWLLPRGVRHGRELERKPDARLFLLGR
jgi:hypothetical protein